MRYRIKIIAILVIVLAGLLGVSCSPEASRTRGGGAGADVGNRRQPVELHGRTDPGWNTPRVGQAIKQ